MPVVVAAVTTPVPVHKEGKKTQKKGLKKKRREEDGVAVRAVNPDPSIATPASPEVLPLLLPRKATKKKALEKKCKRSHGGESDASEEEPHHHQPSKRSPPTPPTLLPNPARDQPKVDATFSDWLDVDEEVMERREMTTTTPALLPAPRGAPQGDEGRQGEAGARHQPPAGPGAHAGDAAEAPPAAFDAAAPHARGRLQPASSHDRERERAATVEPTERKSRIDQLKRREPSRNISSDQQDSHSHSSRPSSLESECQARSRAGSYNSHEWDKEREREHKDLRPQLRDWERPDPDIQDWGGRVREPLTLLLRGRELRELRKREAELERDNHHLSESLLLHDRERERLLLLDLPLHVEMKVRGELEPLMLPRETVSLEVERATDSLHSLEETPEPERPDSVDEDDGKVEDVQFAVSGGEEYEPISDNELDEILADSVQKREDQQEEEMIPGPLDVIDVDWSSLIPKQKAEPREAGAALLRFTPGAVLLRTGMSQRLAGPQLLARVKEACQGELQDPKDMDKLFDHDLGALNMAALKRREDRAGLLRNLGPCCKDLCARRDIAIRRQLLRNDKGTSKHMYTGAPLVDTELLQLSVLLFKKNTTPCQPLSQEKTETGMTLSKPTALPEVCVP
ncbi:hypothetical protein AAFF_G00345450 [Aldrovandia affinis]|uniref:Uncharacterized protein n=1 Tax=Aldrovandia affinis TaxID=143900 RepID=A0AAD7VZI1_9TELE|nr:hypothetical protein AAFF_G00345450 [Aldrovandia affinis]